jgi:hypothetical protein
VVDVPDRADVHVRFGSLEYSFGHLTSSSTLACRFIPVIGTRSG